VVPVRVVGYGIFLFNKGQQHRWS